MKTVGIAIALLILTACGNVPAKPVAAPSPGASPAAQPTSMAPSALLFAVLEARGTTNPSQYNTVAIAGLDGLARAKTTFTPMPVPVLGCMGAILPPSAHVAAGKVYFADGHGVIRSLAIDNKVTVVATFPMTSTQQMLSFAVSPDGTRIFGTLLTVPTTAFSCSGQGSGTYTFDAYYATSATTSLSVRHEERTTPLDIMAFTGWDSVGPFGTYPTVWASQGGGPGSTLGVYTRIDPVTLKPTAPFADPSRCQVWDSVASGGFVCQKDLISSEGKTVAPLSVRKADGTEVWAYNFTSTNGAFGARLAPDGRHASICCAGAGAGSAYSVIGDGAAPVQLAPGFYGEAWIDSQIVVGSYNTNPKAQPPFDLAYVSLSSPDLAVSMGFSGLYVGTVRA